MRRAALVGTALLALAAAGCTGSGTAGPTRTNVTGTTTQTVTTSPGPFTPAPATTVPSRPDDGAAPRGEKKGTCPYIRAGLDIEPTSKDNFADIEGNRVGLVTLLPNHTPVGCRFWFAYDNHAVGDIQPYTFGTAAQARNAMIRTAEAGHDVRSYPDFVTGVDGINYRTKFYGPDDGQDWAFVFAKGRVMVVVHTDQNENNAALVGLYLAQAIVGKF